MTSNYFLKKHQSKEKINPLMFSLLTALTLFFIPTISFPHTAEFRMHAGNVSTIE